MPHPQLPDGTTLLAGCKINLGLRLTGVRDDGYHLLDSLFWPLDTPHDTLHIRPIAGAGIAVRCTTPGIDCANNTLTRAFAAYTARNPLPFSLDVELVKGIPHGAGLGGGSSDAAALLRYLNAHAPAPLPDAELAAVALQVGADVPFFLHNTPCRVRGIGEHVQPVYLPQFAGTPLVLACPAARISTPWAYAAWDARQKRKNLSQCLTSTPGGDNDFYSDAARWVNDLEEPVFAAWPELAAIKAELVRLGAFVALMSGSGAAVFGLFAKAPMADVGAGALRRRGVTVFTGSL